MSTENLKPEEFEENIKTKGKKTRKLKGKIVEEIIREKGIKLTSIAKRMHMSRATLYKKFKSDNLTDIFLFNLGKVIDYDFSQIFSELGNSVFYERHRQRLGDTSPQKIEQHQEIEAIQSKYSKLLEEYNKLLKFLVEVMDENEFHSVKREIGLFIKEYIKKNPTS